MSLLERQVALEEEYSTASIVKGQELILTAFRQGRASELGSGRILLAKAYEASLESFKGYLEHVTTGSVGAKYKRMLQIAKPEVLVMAGLREVINKCASPEPVAMQDILRNVGKVIETESMLACMTEISPEYTERTVEYLDSAGTKSVSHRYRTFLAGAKKMSLNWEAWSASERIGVARLLLTHLYEATGLFNWVLIGTASTYYLKPAEELSKHFDEVQGAARAVVKYPPMLVPPKMWQSQWDGGYLTQWFQQQAPLCGIRYIKRTDREWILDRLASDDAIQVRSAMTKAQNVPYKVNKSVLNVFKRALVMQVGILGLPSSAPKPKPDFPMPEDWAKESASEAELDMFKLWKQQMAAWYTDEAKRVGRKVGLVSKLSELTRYQDEAELYFPTFIDWRGRLYFRSNLNPQSNDAIKGCLEFAEGKRLGERGLFWLKVHIANSCGYDKHDPEIKAAWVDEHWEMIQAFLDNPLDIDAPEPDTAFTLLQAGYAYQDAMAMSNPENYICHVPIAMDATCSGLQHLSALMRDPVGAYYTNLIDNGKEQKSDIYAHVGSLAEEEKFEHCTHKVKNTNKTEPDSMLNLFWEVNSITRGMAKKPVMTFVYGSTLLSSVDSLALEMANLGIQPIRDTSGRVTYSLNALALPVAKALRSGVKKAVPEAAQMMKYMQMLVQKHKDHCMRWVSPVGVPVVNWSEGEVTKKVAIRSMGVVYIVIRYNDGKYNTASAANGVVPNYVHSMDAGHLCRTILDFDGQICPIHDSFATHPSDVDAMHVSLRKTFVELYTEYDFTKQFMDFNNLNVEDYPVPEQGTLDLSSVIHARYMFG